ncbi:MAG: (Fe-S)-binding protein [Desulfomonile tiedjei]|nr:(Fe-S)-binding protein [Desulfomonile tiedjei]
MFSQAIEQDLHHCRKCGMCQQVCPTYKITRQEYFAPRGRAQIVKHYLEGDLKISPRVEQALMSCMLCDACAAFCPSGVRIDRLFRNMRLELDHIFGKPFSKRILFSALSKSSRAWKASAAARAGQSLLVDTLGLQLKVGNIPIEKLPRPNKKPFRQTTPEKLSPKNKKVGRVAYFVGCATDLIYGDVGNAMLEVLLRLGIEVVVPQDQVCCSAPMFLSGAAKQALPNIFKNLDIFDSVDVDAIVVDCATCGSALKKGIPELLEDLGMDAEKSKRVAAKVKDISQIVAEHVDDLPIQDSCSGEPLSVTYHDPCHLIRGMGVSEEPRKILRSLPGVSLVNMEGANECCGGGGSYQFDNVDLSREITLKKKHNIFATGAKIVATGCPGCRLTLAGNLSDDDCTEVVHTIELVRRSLAKEPE